MANNNPNLIFEEDIEGENIKRKFQSFLSDFQRPDPEDPGKLIKVYVEKAKTLIRNHRQTLYVDYRDLIEYSNTFDLAEVIHLEFYKYHPFLRSALQRFIYDIDPDYSMQSMFYIGFTNLAEVDTMRDIKSTKIGKLMSIVGTITKTTEVRPELLVASFSCQLCGAKINEIEQQFKYTTPKMCSSRNCTNKTKWDLVDDRNSSVFADWQKYRVQENSNDIPAGSMPRSIDIIVRCEEVEKGQPGDRCIFVGTPVVVPDLYSMLKPGEKYQLTSQNDSIRADNQVSMQGVTGLRALGVRDLNYKIVFIANNIEKSGNRFGTINIRDNNNKELLESMTENEREEILQISNNPEVYNHMANSICPMVFGNEEIKKGILLMLFGGVNKKTSEGIKLRGDINICTVGDPSTAKSQFLKYVHSFLARSVYTSGKATSAAGLTASVQRDPETGEFTIEAGALMLADNGICCIDEFDKMDDQDQVAIHEAMEQQTISITKAGIQATLNARTSILAAANPIMGRYDKSKTLKANLNISPPIMSRFDLFFVVCDDCEESADTNIARHIVRTHQQKNEIVKADYSVKQMQRYIRFARSINPQMTYEAAVALREHYVRLRSNDVSFQQSNYRITVRQLESLIRLSEARARVQCMSQITPEHVKESARLLSNSILKVHKPDLEIESFRGGVQNTKPDPATAQLSENNKSTKKSKKIRLTNAQYQLMTRAFVHFVKKNEVEQGENQRGMRQSKLQQMYITENISGINNMDEYSELNLKMRAVINRMINNDKTFIVRSEDTSDAKDPQNRMLGLHPNFYSDLQSWWR